MRLRARSLLTFAVTMAAFLAVEVPASILISRWRANHLEEDAASRFARIQAAYIRQHLGRVRFLLELKAEALDVLTRDHAFSIVTYTYLGSRAPDQRDELFSDRALRTAEIDLAVLFDTRGRVVASRLLTPRGSQPSVTPQTSVTDAVSPIGVFGSPPREGLRGLLDLGGTLMMVSSYPVMATGGVGESVGALVFGRRQDAGATAEDSRRLGLEFHILPISSADIPAGERSRLARAETGHTYIPPEHLTLDAAGSTTAILGYGPLQANPRDEPLVLQVKVDPDLLIEQRELVRSQMAEYDIYSAVYLGGVALTNLVFFVVVYLLLNSMVLARVFRINQSAVRIAQDPEAKEMIHQEGGDELAMIGASFNTVLRGLRIRQNDLYGANRRLRVAYRQIAISDQALNASLLPVVLTDAEGRITRVNRAFERVLGYTPEEAVGQRSSLLNPGRGTDLDHGVYDAAYDRLFRTLWDRIRGEGEGTWEGTLLNRRKTGEVVPMQVVIHAIRSEEDGRLGFVAWMIDLSKRIEAEEKVRLEVYRAISELAEARDSDTGLHLKRIAFLSSLLARKLGWGPRKLQEIETFAPLHDVGKVGIADSVLLAPGKLSREQFEIMKTHAEIGYSILKDRPTMEMAAQIAHGHHEKWDGTGYPRGLKGEEIPVAARIVSIADVFDALRSHRPYKEPWPLDKTLAEIERLGGSHLDPNLVSIFLRDAAEFEAIYQSLTAPADDPRA